ncbi:MAG: helix-turn-helix domain-containing protein [Clostridiales bacterium]|nr:helix-turn-helix domain-containing protein [Clostridiales bacterium]
MEHQAVMDFLAGTLRRMRLNLSIFEPEEPLEMADLGLRALLGLREDYHSLARAFFRMMKPKTVYKLMDPFLCSYLFFAMPNSTRTVVVGPYLTSDLTNEAVLEMTERLGLPLQMASQMTEFYASLPVFEDTAMLMALISTMGDTLWGGVDAFETIDLNRDTGVPLPIANDVAAMEENQLTMRMKYIEARYDYENQMIDAVAKGMIQRVELITSHISQLNFEQRMADPLRNAKNYCIICNTLLRKAAEKGGVHPLHVDRISSQYAVQIENKATTEGCVQLIGEMFRAYCRLVRSHAISQYSAPVQKALVYMEENLSGELGLQTLAEVLQLSPGYLSELFHREVGQTVVQHITELRMKHAQHLLQTTQLQVQNVAQLCGIADANYFSKLFRKYHSMTPRQYKQRLTLPMAETSRSDK